MHNRRGKLGSKKLYQLISMVAVGALGVIMLAISNAATPTASIEAESGIGAVSVADTTASGGMAVKFGSPGTARTPGIYVSGNKLVNGQGSELLLHGVNKMGSEYACIDGWGFFDGPADQASINAMKTWNINAVRIPMNSVCWLGTAQQSQFTSYNAAYAGTNYQNAIKNYVNLLNQNGIYAILDLQWAGCGTGNCYANWIKSMPDRPYAVQYWSQVATAFKNNKSVLFDLYNEPEDTTWECWLSGGCTAYAGGDMAYTQAGMQEMITAIRNAGATTQPIMVGGLQYANDVSEWASHAPTDPNNSLVVSVHLYPNNWPCGGPASNAITCFSSGSNDLTPLRAVHPVYFGELGGEDCTTTFVAPMLDWIRTNNMSVNGWTWNPYPCDGAQLITDFNGTPSTLGSAFKNAYTTKYPAWKGIQ